MLLMVTDLPLHSACNLCFAQICPISNASCALTRFSAYWACLLQRVLYREPRSRCLFWERHSCFSVERHIESVRHPEDALVVHFEGRLLRLCAGNGMMNLLHPPTRTLRLMYSHRKYAGR